MGRGDLTDEQWVVLEPLLAKGTRAGRPPVWPRRQLIDGIRFRVRTGVPWRVVPAEYGPWNRVYDLFRRWQRNGTWHRILTCLRSLADADGAITWNLNVDSTVCRPHQHAAGARKQGDLQKEPPVACSPSLVITGWAARAAGSAPSCTWPSSRARNPMAILVTAGQRGDSPQFEPVLEKVRVPRIGPGRPRVRPHRVRADKAYASRKNALTCGAAGSAAPFRTRPTRRATATSSAPATADRRIPSRRTTASAMRSSAASTGSSGTGRWPPGSTNSRSSRPPSSSP
ncbi:IS5 family transposase [Streptomyces halstedii]|uniref:IS5 family transposase n=1 Tax=Streptomyces halstedii TaxID=1944 RepID=UPI00339EE314